MTLAELVALAERATPGPWVVRHTSERDDVATIEPAPETMEGHNYWIVFTTNMRRDEWKENASFVAALSPEVVIALARVVQAADTMRHRGHELEYDEARNELDKAMGEKR